MSYTLTGTFSFGVMFYAFLAFILDKSFSWYAVFVGIVLFLIVDTIIYITGAHAQYRNYRAKLLDFEIAKLNAKARR